MRYRCFDGFLLTVGLIHWEERETRQKTIQLRLPRRFHIVSFQSTHIKSIKSKWYKLDSYFRNSGNQCFVITISRVSEGGCISSPPAPKGVDAPWLKLSKGVPAQGKECFSTRRAGSAMDQSRSSLRLEDYHWYMYMYQ